MNRIYTLLTAVFMAALLVIAPLAEQVRGEEDSELHKQMEIMDKAVKALRKSLKDPAANKESLDTIGKLQAAAVASKSQAPSMAATVAEGEREKFLSAYRKDMAALISEMCQLEIAVVDGNNEKAQEMLKGLKKLEEDGHEKFTQE